MKVAFVGKGGSGKTTMASLFARRAAALGYSVMAVDADINQHLAAALGINLETAATMGWRVLGERMPEIMDHLRGNNRRIRTASEMIKTTPPGRGSRLVTPSTIKSPDSPFNELFIEADGIQFAATGGFTDDDLGVSCFHRKTGAVELLLNHMIDETNEFIVVDMTAGADAFASGLFTRFDQTFLVCEPTLRSVGVYEQYAGYAEDYDVNIAVIGNKIDDEDDVAFLREHVGDDTLIGWCTRSKYIKAAERGQFDSIDNLEEENLAVIDIVLDRALGTNRDWRKFTRQAREFHLLNAQAWGNDKTGVSLADQIDPDFELSDLVEPAS